MYIMTSRWLLFIKVIKSRQTLSKYHIDRMSTILTGLLLVHKQDQFAFICFFDHLYCKHSYICISLILLYGQKRVIQIKQMELELYLLSGESFINNNLTCMSIKQKNTIIKNFVLKSLFFVTKATFSYIFKRLDVQNKLIYPFLVAM